MKLAPDAALSQPKGEVTLDSLDRQQLVLEAAWNRLPAGNYTQPEGEAEVTK